MSTAPLTRAAGQPPRRLVVLRHGETTHNAAGVWQGQLDSPLSARGRAQALAVAPAIAALGPTRIVSSDLVRARDTAQAVAAACGDLPVALDERFREIHAGEWQGLTVAEVKERDPDLEARVRAGEDVRRGHTGESMAHVHDRVRAAALDLVAAMDPGECAVVVSHGVSGRALAAELLGIAPEDSWRILTIAGNCHHAELVEGRKGWRLVTWNVAPAAVPDHGVTPP